jgi:hypothetical protein
MTGQTSRHPSDPCSFVLCAFCQSRADELRAIFNAASGRVDRQVISIPRLVITTDDSLPIWKNQTGNFGVPCFDAPAMLPEVRTYRFDFEDLSRGPPEGADKTLTFQKLTPITCIHPKRGERRFWSNVGCGAV